MRWGFHQVLLSERTQKIFTFVTPFGSFAYRMKSSPRAVLALSYPNEAEIKMQNRYKQRSMKLR